jgi:pimeloyl-ACP methyl ester carboxylesterase
MNAMTHHHSLKRLAGLLATAVIIAASTAFAAASPAASAASPAASSRTKPTVILVHGAWADSSNWSGVISRLQADGYPVIAPANPLRGLAADAAYLSSVIATVSGPIVLVGHSYGGAVITNAAADPDVKALVYIAAFAPAEGESAFALTAGHKGSHIAPEALTTRPYPGAPTGDVDVYINPANFRDIVAADQPRGSAAVLAATQRPITFSALNAPSGPPAWKSVPSWYAVADADHAIPPAAQRFMAARAGAHTVQLAGASHAVPLSRPGAVADLIRRAAR